MTGAAAGPAVFATWLHDQLTARGYDLSGPRSGGIRDAAAHSGISPATMSRLVRGTRAVNDIDVYRRLARWLDHPLGDILVRAGQLQPEDLRLDPLDQMTPERAADGFGIVDPASRRAFMAMVEVLRRIPPA